MAFKFANRDRTTRYENDEGDYILVRAEISKKEHMDLTRDINPTAETRTVDEFYGMLEKFFELVMVDWSLTQEVEGKEEKIPVSIEAYHAMDTESSTQIDEWLNQHMREKFGREVEEIEGEAKG